MKFPTECKIESATSTDKHRWTMNDPFLDCTPEQPIMVATDGYIMAVVPVEATKEEQGFLTATALKAARKLARKSDTAELTCNGSFTLTDGSTLPRPTEHSEGKGPFIQYQNVLNSVVRPDRPSIVRIGLNAALLMRLAEALGTEELVLDIETSNTCVLVTPLNATDTRKGLIMPMKVK